MAMHYSSTCARRVDGTVRYLCRAARYMGAAVLRAARARDSTGDKDFAIHSKRHSLLPYFFKTYQACAGLLNSLRNFHDKNRNYF